MKQIKMILMALLAFTATTSLKAFTTDELTYRQPSTTWMGSLPLGNGRIGAMVYGGTAVETIALNEVTMWSGQPDPEVNNLCGKERLKEIRDAFFHGDVAKGNDLGTKYLSGHDRSFGTHLPMGDLLVKFRGHDEAPTGYLRRLALDRALADITYHIGTTRYSHQYFCSNPAQVFVARYTASTRHGLSATLSMRMLRHSTVTASGRQLEIAGDARFDKFGEGGVKFLSIVRVVNDGGTVTASGDSLIVEGANALTVVVDIRTNYQNPDYEALCRSTVDKAAAQPYEEEKLAHIRDFSRLYRRMNLYLGPTTTSLTTDEMFQRAKKGETLPAFDALFFKYGRYMLLSSSRANSPLPANLQGIWNDNLACNMPWTCDYHLDINIQQNYWSANIANMAECNTPLFRYLDMLAKYGHETARKVYGCDGWVTHTVNNVWGDTAPGGGVGWGLHVTAGAWMATQLWAHYDFTRDRDWLQREGYPLIKQTAQFFCDYMVTDPATGYLVSGPSISPENTFRMADGNVFCLSMMPTIDRAVIYDTYHACIEASRLLSVDADLRARLEKDIQRLPPYKVGKDGALMEWMLDVYRNDAAHRHASHLVALYPLGQISPEKTPELARSCERFLDLQTKSGAWEDTEWTRGNMMNFYARLKKGNEAYDALKGLYRGFMRENLMTVSPAGVAGAQEDIFSFDATEAAVSGTCEMLLQSYDGLLDFLPALPDAWATGSISGICARGGIVADMTWKNRRVTSVALKSTTTQRVTCRINGALQTLDLKAQQTKKIKL
jgi:alpha-L-fucosidase 2